MAERMNSLDSCLGAALPAPLRQRLAVMKLVAAWPQVAGKRIADNTKIIAVEPPTLKLAAYTSVWLQQLQMRTPQLLKKINEFYGAKVMTAIDLVMYRHSFVKEADDEARELLGAPLERKKIDGAKTALTAAEAAAIDASVQAVSDPALAAVIRRARINQAKKDRHMAAAGYHRCRDCGRFIDGERPLCAGCLHKLHRRQVVAVKDVLRRYPFYKLDDVRRLHRWCDQPLYGEAKRELIYLYLRRSYEGTREWADLYTAAMLITGKPREALTPDFVINLTNTYLPDDKKRKVVTT